LGVDVVAEAIVFVAASAGLLYVSRRSLRARRSHGFYRFFAWESILALLLLNWERWFQDPVSLHQVVSWLLLTASAALVVHGVCLLRRVGRPSEERNEDATLIGIERTTTLVTVGAFKYIRHPLYSSGLCLAWGVFLKNPSRLGGVFALAATILLVVTAKVEEAECVQSFGPAYQAYMTRTKMFVPFLF
jgi:protein-S-isoprenylcysteine O-methyltransferase Ste14